MVFTGPNPFIKIPTCTVLKESGVQLKKERALLSYIRFHNEEAEVEKEGERGRRKGGPCFWSLLSLRNHGFQTSEVNLATSPLPFKSYIWMVRTSEVN